MWSEWHSSRYTLSIRALAGKQRHWRQVMQLDLDLGQHCQEATSRSACIHPSHPPLLSLPQLNLSLERSIHWYIATRQTMSAANRLIWKYIRDIIFLAEIYCRSRTTDAREWRERDDIGGLARRWHETARSRNESARPRNVAQWKRKTTRSRTTKKRNWTISHNKRARANGLPSKQPHN